VYLALGGRGGADDDARTERAILLESTVQHVRLSLIHSFIRSLDRWIARELTWSPTLTNECIHERTMLTRIASDRPLELFRLSLWNNHTQEETGYAWVKYKDLKVPLYHSTTLTRERERHTPTDLG